MMVLTVAAKRRNLLACVAILGLALFAYNALFSFSYSVGPNYRNVSVDTRVNITFSAPEIVLITLSNPVTLNAGQETMVQCNVSVRDYTGASYINMTNATLYHQDSESYSPDDNNTHYTNTNCTLVDESLMFKNFTCNFSVQYYAQNGTWWCNATTFDTTIYNDTAWNATNFSAVLALNVTDLIDYGNLAVGDTSANITADITNIGNVPINVSVAGFGDTQGDGLAFVCEHGNISIEYEKFSSNASYDYAQKTDLSGDFKMVENLSIAKQVDADLQQNTTYWQLYVPVGPAGQCNGTVIFQAELA